MSLNVFAAENGLGSMSDSSGVVGELIYQQNTIDDSTYEGYITNTTTGETGVLRVTKDENGNDVVQGWNDIEVGCNYLLQHWDFQISVSSGGDVIFSEAGGSSEIIGTVIEYEEAFPGSSARVTYPTDWYKSTIYGNLDTAGNVVTIAGKILSLF